MTNCVCVPLTSSKNRDKTKQANQLKQEVKEIKKLGYKIRLVINKDYISYEYEDFRKDI